MKVNALRRALGSSLVQAFLVLVGLIWLTPLAGLLLSSLRSTEDTARGGWWTALTSPGRLSFDNYSSCWGTTASPRRSGTPY